MKENYLVMFNSDVVVFDLAKDGSFPIWLKALKIVGERYGKRKILYTWTESSSQKVIIILEPEIRKKGSKGYHDVAEYYKD